jgi:hypothetical protein
VGDGLVIPQVMRVDGRDEYFTENSSARTLTLLPKAAVVSGKRAENSWTMGRTTSFFVPPFVLTYAPDIAPAISPGFVRAYGFPRSARSSPPEEAHSRGHAPVCSFPMQRRDGA